MRFVHTPSMGGEEGGEGREERDVVVRFEDVLSLRCILQAVLGRARVCYDFCVSQCVLLPQKNPFSSFGTKFERALHAFDATRGAPLYYSPHRPCTSNFQQCASVIRTHLY